MSKENLVKLMQAAAENEQLGQQLQSASSYEEVKNLARQQGFDLGDLSAEAAGRTVDVLSGEASGELSDEELELVAGGNNFEEVKVTFKRFKGLIGDDIGII
jgi:predicted ribosomally synthesized peptide with nif11-like leader